MMKITVSEINGRTSTDTMNVAQADKLVVRVRVTGLNAVGLSVLYGALLLFVFFLLASVFTVRPVAAAGTGSTDEAAMISFSSAVYTVSEAVGNAKIILLVDPPVSTPVTVTVSSGNVQAEAPSDFQGLRQSLVITPSAPSYTLALTIVDDEWVEGNEQLRLTLGEYHGVEPGTITETLVTIEDNDVAYLTIHDVAVNEEAGSVSLQVIQSLTSTFETIVDVRTHEGSATSPEDFSALSTTVSILPGTTAATVTVPLNGDSLVESTENFFVALEDVTNAEIETTTATVTITDDDSLPQILLDTAEADEEDGEITFLVTLSSSWAQTVTVEYATMDGSALAPSDYVTSTGVITIAPGELTATVVITLVDDQMEEPNESMFLTFTNPIQAILSSDAVEGIIRSSDQPGNDFDSFLFLPGLERE